jgi:penicillin-binding protein 2
MGFWLVIGLLVFRIYYLQIMRGDHFGDLSENNRVRRIRLAAPRGRVFDRDGQALVINRPSFDISLMLEDIEDPGAVLKMLSELTGVSPEELNASLEKQKRTTRRFQPKVVIGDVSRDVLARVRARTHELPGVIVEVSARRFYPNDAEASQVFGYSREITTQELTSRKSRGYVGGDEIGKTGLERQWEQTLRGVAGTTLVEVDAVGQHRGEYGRVEPSPGHDLTLTLDTSLQGIAHHVLQPMRGAIVAIDPRNGDVLALASEPALDANIFSGAITSETWEQITADPTLPLNNRSISAAYPPGSTFKLFMAAAGLHSGLITGNTHLPCPGYFYFAGRPWRCHRRSGHGDIGLEEAVALSCNAYFFRLGHLMEIDEIHHYGSAFGFGALTGIRLPGEVSGVMPSRDWKRGITGEKWYPGDTLPVSVGQGYLTVTPLQLAVAVSALVNGGKVYEPRVVQKITAPVTGEVWENYTELKSEVFVDDGYLKQVKKIGVAVTEHKRGTGKRARIEGISIGGKTGTAQVSSLETGNTTEELQDHAWFVSYAPAEEPEIVVVVFVENAGVGGGVAAAPRARAVLEAYFRKSGRLVLDPEQEGSRQLEGGGNVEAG